MTNTALFDAIKSAGPISAQQITAIADAVDAKMAPRIDALHATANRIDETTTKTLEGQGPAEIGGDDFARIRKCLQLLNRLEDWDLADQFDGYGEFKHDEFDNLRGACLDGWNEDAADIGELLAALKAEFPMADDPEARAEYYLKLLSARITMLNALTSDPQVVAVRSSSVTSLQPAAAQRRGSPARRAPGGSRKPRPRRRRARR